MALLYTPLNSNLTKMPDFRLPTVDGANWDSKSISKAPAKVLVFMCNHCPYVKAIENRLIHLAADLKSLNVPFIGICSNDPSEYPEDAPTELLKRWQEKNYSFPYLIDESQQVAKLFGAVCTPDFFVFNSDNNLVYRGRLDDSWKNPQNVTREELKIAVLQILENNTAPVNQTPSMGCSIKWKSM
jgi:peroxiredoxin